MNRGVVVSVVVPFHRLDSFLFDCLDSVLASDYPSFEVVAVANGAAVAGVGEVEQRYAGESRLRVLVSRETELVDSSGLAVASAAGGAGSVSGSVSASVSVEVRQNFVRFMRARNFVVEQARGEFIAVMDADDLMLPQRLAEQVAYLRAHPEVAVVGMQLEYMCVHGSPVGRSRLPLRSRRGWLGRPILPVVAQPATMFRKADWVRVGGYRDWFCFVEDLDLWNRLFDVGQIHNLAGVGLRYRVHGGQISTVNAALQVVESLRADLFAVLGVVPVLPVWPVVGAGLGELLGLRRVLVGLSRGRGLVRRLQARRVVGYFWVMLLAQEFAHQVRQHSPRAFARLVLLGTYPGSLLTITGKGMRRLVRRTGPRLGNCVTCSTEASATNS